VLFYIKQQGATPVNWDTFSKDIALERLLNLKQQVGESIFGKNQCSRSEYHERDSGGDAQNSRNRIFN